MLFKQPLRTFTTAKVKTEKDKDPVVESPFDYTKMDHYQILQCLPTATEPELKKSFLKLAKKYHPDVYKGPNKEHFKKVLEVYNILKNPVKRSDYDKHSRIKSMKGNKEYQDYEKKMRAEGKEWSHEMYEEMMK